MHTVRSKYNVHVSKVYGRIGGQEGRNGGGGGGGGGERESEGGGGGGGVGIYIIFEFQ